VGRTNAADPDCVEEMAAVLAALFSGSGVIAVVYELDDLMTTAVRVMVRDAKYLDILSVGVDSHVNLVRFARVPLMVDHGSSRKAVELVCWGAWNAPREGCLPKQSCYQISTCLLSRRTLCILRLKQRILADPNLVGSFRWTRGLRLIVACSL